MKRCVSTDEHISKRVKLYTVFDDPELARNPQDVLANGLDDDSGYIACKCFMTWRPTNRKHKAILETMRTVPRLRFDVEFAGACIPFFSNIELKGQDELLLALTSAQIESATVSQVCNIPLKLIYEEGVIIKFVKRKGPCIIVDTWRLSEDAKAHEDSWFHDPIDLTGNMEIPSALSSKEQLNTGSASVSELSHASAPVPMLETAPAKPMHHTSSIEAIQDSKLLKKERKKLRKKERALQIACNSGREKEKTAVGGVFAEHTPLATVVHQRTTSHTADVPGSDQNFPRLEPHLSPNQTTAKAPPTGTIALVTPAEQYHHLAALDDAFALIQFNVIGVVVHASALKRTSTGDWSCSLRLADPSNTVVDNLNGREGFVINCFTSKYEGWIPQPSIGEVLVMQDVKFSMHHRYPMGIGYHGKLKWAIYSPSSGRICHSNLKDTPKSDNLAMGGGYAFSPFLNPDEAAIRYCIKMADWWADAEKRRKSIATVHQVGATNFSLSRQGRQHRLISEASPDAPPSGYFDCVVEALNVHSNDNGVYSLYVTDYTINSGVAPVQAEWCPPGLGDYVLKIEVWDNAVAKAQTMYTGEYYSIGNARMRVSRGGYVEGKVVEDKIRRLDDADITHNDHFRKLLERVSFSSAHNFRSHWYRRKKDWQTANQGAEQHDEFKYQIVSEAVEGRHFHCVVEVLHAKYAGDGASCIYVTDYTSRSELVTGMVQNSWGGAGLDGRILKIVLFNNQAEMAKTVQVGSFYDIKKLRLKQSVTAREFQGHLGGAERLIHLRNPNNAVDDEGLLQALKQRKGEWEQSLGISQMSVRTHVPVDPYTTASTSLPNKTAMSSAKTIVELLASKKCPNKSRIVARVVDFHPWKLSEAFYTQCTRCKKELPELQKACFDCADSDKEYVRYKYQMYWMLQDKGNSQLQVSVHDGSLIFEGLERGDLGTNYKVYQALLNRLTGIFGDLLKMHSGPKPAEGGTLPLLDTPMLAMTVDSWEVDGKRAYCLADCDLPVVG